MNVWRRFLLYILASFFLRPLGLQDYRYKQKCSRVVADSMLLFQSVFSIPLSAHGHYNYKKLAAIWACNVKSLFPESRANRVSHLIWGKMAKSVRSVRMCASARVSFHPALSFSLNYLEKGWGVHPARRRKNRNQDRLKRTSVLFTKSVVELLGSLCETIWPNHICSNRRRVILRSL